jgi:hypothetical protein
VYKVKFERVIKGMVAILVDLHRRFCGGNKAFSPQILVFFCFSNYVITKKGEHHILPFETKIVTLF